MAAILECVPNISEGLDLHFSAAELVEAPKKEIQNISK
jgi:glutamate formiminotransferase